MIDMDIKHRSRSDNVLYRFQALPQKTTQYSNMLQSYHYIVSKAILESI